MLFLNVRSIKSAATAFSMKEPKPNILYPIFLISSGASSIPGINAVEVMLGKIPYIALLFNW